MKKLSANGIIVCAGLLMTGITSAINASTAQSTITAPTKNYQNISYTASGKTDRKTAMLFQQLIKNNKNLQIHAKVIKKPAPKRNRQVEVAVDHTVHGKTDMKTLRKLIKLFQTSEEVYVSATTNVRSNTAKRNPKMEVPKPQRNQDRYNNSDSAYAYSYYPPVYSTAYAYGYNGYPPIYIQGNTMWVPVPVYQQPTLDNQVKYTQSNPPYPMVAAY